MESTQKERKTSYKFYNLKYEEITEGLQEMMILVLVKTQDTKTFLPYCI